LLTTLLTTHRNIKGYSDSDSFIVEDERCVRTSSFPDRHFHTATQTIVQESKSKQHSHK